MDVRLGLSPQLRAIVAGVLLPLHLASCNTWKTQTMPPTEPDHVRLELADGRALELWNARFGADSVIGYTHGERDSTRVSVPAATVVRVQTRGMKTTFVVITVVTFAVVMTALIVCSGSNSQGQGHCEYNMR